MPSPLAFLVNGLVFFDPHPGRQAATVQAITARVCGTGPGPRNFFIRGNRGSGKSKLVRSLFHGFALAFPGLKYIIVRRNLPDLRQNHLIYVGPELRQLGGEYHETFGMAKYANGSIGFYRPCEDMKDVEKIVGSEAALLFVDEAPQIPWDLLSTMRPSLRVPVRADGTPAPYRTCTVYGGNPIGDSIDELDHYFLDHDVAAEDDPEYVAADYETLPLFLADNPSLDPVEYRKQFSGLREYYRKAWLDGERVLDRTLFDVYPTKDGRPWHYIDELPQVNGQPVLKTPWLQLYRAFDMGYSPDPAICLWIAVLGERVLIVHEETWFRTIAKDLAARIVETTRELVGDTPVAMTYIDPKCAHIGPSAADTVTVRDMLEMHGVPCEPSINDRILYADAIHGLLGETLESGVPKLQIYVPGCPNLAKYLPKMRWDEANPRKMADHKYDHWPIGLAYFAISSGVLARSAALDERAAEPVGLAWLREDSQRSPRRRGA